MRRKEEVKIKRGAALGLASTAGVATWIVLTDVHVPYHDVNCLDAICSLMADLQPTGIVLGGDFLDFYEISHHNAGSVGKLEGRRFRDTFDAANLLLDRLLAVDSLTQRIYVDGNHEDRLRRWLAAGDNAVFTGDPGFSIGERLRLRDRGVVYLEGYPSASVGLGHLLVTHGRWCNKYHANKHLDEYRHSVMYGHTHSPQTIYTSAYGAQQVSIGLGHLADPDSEAMDYAPKPNKWCQGFGLVHVHPDQSFNAAPINFWAGQFVYGGKVYGKRRP